jgi:hypothetical protein
VLRAIENGSGKIDLGKFESWWTECAGKTHTLVRGDERVRDHGKVLLQFSAAFKMLEHRDGVTALSPTQMREVLVAVAADDWIEMKDKVSGRPYWFNKFDRTSSWHDPGGKGVQDDTVMRFLRECGVVCGAHDV